MDKNVVPLLPLKKLDFLSREIILHRVTANIRDAASRAADTEPDAESCTTTFSDPTSAATASVSATVSSNFGANKISTGLNLESSIENPLPIGTAIVQFYPVVGIDVFVESDTIKTFDIKHQCITCMKEYRNKSFEELRLEDYVAGRIDGAFGFQQKERSTPVLEQRPQSAVISSSHHQQRCSGTGIVRYYPVIGTDLIIKSGMSLEIPTRYHCITCMKQYRSKSVEELRLEDYSVGRQFGGLNTRRGNPFRWSKGSYWERPQPTGRGHAKYYAVVGVGPRIKSGERGISNKYHCITLMHQYKRKSFEELRLEDYKDGRTYGVIEMQQKDSDTCGSDRGTGSKDNIFNLGHLRDVLDVPNKSGYWENYRGSGTANPRYCPVVGVSPRMEYGSNQNNEIYHCITFMQQYSGKSFEELRLEDYKAKIKGL